MSSTKLTYVFTPEYDYSNFGIMEDIKFICGTLLKISQCMDRDIFRITHKAEEGIKWANDVLAVLNRESELICDAHRLLNDPEGYPENLRKAKKMLVELSKFTLSEEMKQAVRLCQNKPYAAELSIKASAIGSAVSTTIYYVSKVIAFFPKEKEECIS